MRKVLAAFLALAACAGAAFADPVPKSDGSISSAPPATRTVAQLPACVIATTVEGRRYTLTDALDATDQTVGLGTNRHVAVCQQGVWIAENPAGAGGHLTHWAARRTRRTRSRTSTRR